MCISREAGERILGYRIGPFLFCWRWRKGEIENNANERLMWQCSFGHSELLKVERIVFESFLVKWKLSQIIAGKANIYSTSIRGKSHLELSAIDCLK